MSDQNYDNIVAQLGSIMKPNGDVDMAVAKTAAKDVVAQLKSMSPQDATKLGEMAGGQLARLSLRVDSDHDGVVSEGEFLAFAKKGENQIMDLVPREYRNTLTAVANTGVAAHGSDLVAQCSADNIPALQREFDDAEKKVNETLGNLHAGGGTASAIADGFSNLANRLSIPSIKGAGATANDMLMQHFHDPKLQLDPKGQENLRTILAVASKNAPTEVDFPSAEEACQVALAKLPSPMTPKPSDEKRTMVADAAKGRS